MKVVVVGGTGNISRSIVALLLERGHEVTCFNRGKSGEVPEGVRLILGDRKLDPADFEEKMQKEHFDAAIDMICYKPEHAESDLRAFRDVGHLVYCSTVNTYGLDFDRLPVDEEHPLRPVTPYGAGKAAADHVFLRAYHDTGFPVTVIKPSTTYGNKLGLLRQLGRDFSWLDRIRKGKPILVCGDGKAIHQFLHVDDAALGFVGAMEREATVGQTYNLVRRGCISFDEYHRTAMKVIGREVDMVGVPLAAIAALDQPQFKLCLDEFAYNLYFSGEKIARDIPEFCPRISLEEGMASVLEALDRAGRIPNSDDFTWEDALIAQSRALGRGVSFDG